MITESSGAKATIAVPTAPPIKLTATATLEPRAKLDDEVGGNNYCKMILCKHASKTRHIQDSNYNLQFAETELFPSEVYE